MTSLQNLFVAKLPRNLTDGDLEQIFVEYHPTSAKVMLDATTGKSKGFGFVLFESEDAGRKAYEKLNKTHVTLHGHNFNLCIFPSKHDGKVATEESNALYVRNIPLKLTELEVEQFLRGFGPLTYCAMREDNFGGSVWVVYAEFSTVESAKRALTSLHGNRSYFNTSVAILAKYADTDEAKRERRRRREQQQHDAPHATEPPTNASGGGRGFASHGHRAPPPPVRTSSGHSSAGHSMPHSYSSSEVHTENGAAPPHPPSFASIAHHFAPTRHGGGIPPPPAVPPGPPTLVSSTLQQPQQHQQQQQFQQQQQQPQHPHQQQYQQPQQGSLMPGQQQPPTPNSMSSFLHVTFNPTQANNGANNFTQYGGLEQTPSRGSPSTPLNFSFGHEMDNSGAIPHGSAAGSNGMLDASGNAPTTPVRRSSNLSTSSSYRHNPYAPVTPVSSSHNSTGPSTPVVSSIVLPTAPHVHMHFGASHHMQSSPYPPGQGMGTASAAHFASRGTSAYMAAPTGVGEYNQ
ncbi:RNA recognition motif (RRM, RBD, or RNP domain) [Novymonas esmeraldas]|uniref:RNA recognition motif (RRM, RBD, or RNP domain) n=1 Tax=Novymonas esmeraldas TaxID=1808958 RepID=A0AAW0F6T6_9TRYP